MDLDDLKYVNDSVGYGTGDKLLAELAVLIKKHMRATDMLARLDGDEFALLITETRPSRVEFVVERLPSALRSAISCERPAARASVKLATLAHAMRRMNPTAASKT